ncbi:hypothetical protein CKO51_07995 [Rhodopirellula sp. SM50]|nr:hypothetical protein CKO51_07995 [Rhodopirellula sp. SM50]
MRSREGWGENRGRQNDSGQNDGRGGDKEKGRGGDKETRREGERERGRQGERERGREGERERGREGERERGREGERERGRQPVALLRPHSASYHSAPNHSANPSPVSLTSSSPANSQRCASATGWGQLQTRKKSACWHQRPTG